MRNRKRITAIIRAIVGIPVKIIRKIAFWIMLREMDNLWYYLGLSSYTLFPPSFYYTHTREEVERITAMEIEKLREIIEQLE